MTRLKDKVCIITGGTTGIGEATSRLFAEEGATLIMVNKYAEGGESLAKELGENVYFFQADVSDAESVKALMKFVEEKFGVLDVLFNNAALSISNNIELTTEECWNRTFETNARGCFLCSKYALPLLRKSEHASIINTASELAIVGCRDNLAYNASKGAIMSFTRSLALELAPDKIRVNAVCPAGTMTQAFCDDIKKNGKDLDEELRKIIESYPLGQAYGRVGLPRDVGYAVLFLAGDESTWITGTHIMVDGGFTAT